MGRFIYIGNELMRAIIEESKMREPNYYITTAEDVRRRAECEGDPEALHAEELRKQYHEFVQMFVMQDNQDQYWAEAKRKEAEETIAQLTAQLEKEREYGRDLEKQIEKLESEIESLTRTREDFCKIQRERANADRDVRPKTSRSGYLLMRSEQYAERVYTDDGPEIVPVWKSQLQTYWEAQHIQYDVAYDNIRYELMATITPRISVEDTGFFDLEYEKKPTVLLNYIKLNINVFYRLQLIRNTQKGYWEAVLYHTKPFEEIPDDLYPSDSPLSSTKKKGENKKEK